MKPKTKNFEIKLEALDPTGVATKSESLSMLVVDDQENGINIDRLFIHIGECLYRVDKKGFIIERIIPIDHTNKTANDNFLMKDISNEIDCLKNQKETMIDASINLFEDNIKTVCPNCGEDDYWEQKNCICQQCGHSW